MTTKETTPDLDDGPIVEEYEEVGKKRVTGLVYWITLFLGGFGILVAINQTFNINAFGYVLIDNSYYYLLIAVFLSLALLIYPARKKDADHVPVYDWVLFALTIVASLYLSYCGGDMVLHGWDLVAPPEPTFVAAIMCFLALEGVRFLPSKAFAALAAQFCSAFAVYFHLPALDRSRSRFSLGGRQEPGRTGPRLCHGL